MKVRRGFRKDAEAYAEEFRGELHLDLDGPLCPHDLASHLAIPVTPLSQLPGLDVAHLRYVTADGQSIFSATTVVDGTFKMIIHNDAHSLYRQNSNVMHEIAHIVLGHPARPPMTSDKCRTFDPTLEEEANQLGFTLLIPKLAALRIVESGMATDVACKFYGVSRPLLNHRIAITDARRWASNRRKYRSAAE